MIARPRRAQEVHAYAVVGGWAAYAIASEVGDSLEELGRLLLANPRQQEIGQELLEAVAQMRMAGRLRVQAHRGIAAGGNAALPQRVAGAGSERPSSGGAGLRTDEVAVMFDVKPRQVRNLAEQNGGPLAATKVGGTWIFDEASVAMELERRAAG